MAHPGKAPSLEVLGYNYWKTRMKAYLLSQGSEIWEITQFAAVGDVEFERVCHLTMARDVWTTLADHHEGTAQVKARLF